MQNNSVKSVDAAPSDGIFKGFEFLVMVFNF